MANAAQITTLLGSLKHDIGAFQTQLEETWSKVKDETKPIWAGEDNAGLLGWKFVDKKTRLNPNFQLKAYIQTNRDLKVFEKALAEIETLRAVAPIDSNQNKANVYRLVNTMLKFYTTVQKRLIEFRDFKGDAKQLGWASQWWTRASTVFTLTTDAKTAIGAEADVGEDPAKQQEIQTYAHNIELKAYATLIRSALDRAIQQLQDRKTKPASWWGQIDAQKRESKRAAADTLLTDKTITGIYALQFIAKQQETNPNQLYITWLFQKINDMYRANWDLFVRLRGETLKTETFKYVYNQVPIIGWIGLRPSSAAEAAIQPLPIVPGQRIPDGYARIAGGVITVGYAITSASADRDPSLRPSQYDPIPTDQIPPDPTIQEQFPEAVKAADAVPKSATTTGAAPATAPATAPGATPATAPGATAPGATAPGTAPGATPTPGALSTEDVDALIKLDGQEGTDVFFYGVRPIKLPPGDLPADWKERPAYRAIADQLNLINHASQHKKEAGWIDTIFKEIGLGCTSDRQIMFSTKCPTFRTYLEELALQMLDMGAFQFIAPETPTAESYGSVAITITAKFSALTADAELLQADESLRPLLVQIRDLETFIKSLNPTPISTPDLTAINTMLADLTKDLTSLGITI